MLLLLPKSQPLRWVVIWDRRSAAFFDFAEISVLTVICIKITTPFGVVIFMARGSNPNPLRLFAILLEKYPIDRLVGGAFAPYKRFATGKTLAQGEFTSPEHFNHRRVERPTGAKPKRKCDLSKQVAFSFGTPEGTRTPSLQNRNLTLYPIALRARLTRDHQRARLL